MNRNRQASNPEIDTKLNIECYNCKDNDCHNTFLTSYTDKNTEENNLKPNRSKSRHRASASRSIFMKIGKYLKEPAEDPLYDIQNFEAIRSSKNNRKLNIIGSGAFGDVYTARNKIDGNTYAIKRMHKKKIIEAGESLEIVYREISIHRRLIHENIVKAYSHHEDEKYIYLILEYLNSGTLFDLIKKNNGMDEKRAFNYLIQTVSAVNFLHENNLIHRDLKPENLLLDENDNLKLCDFGWCVNVREGLRITFCGTYEYMAPEMYQQLPYDYAIDIWTLGILIYELVHGYSPFRAKNDDSKISEKEDYEEDHGFEDIYNNIMNYDLKFEKEISKNCEDLIKKLLSPSIKNRIKIKEIYSHPWVQELEKEFKQEKIKKLLEEKAEEKLNDSNMNSQKIEELIKKSESLTIHANNDFLNFNDVTMNQAHSTKYKISDKIQFFENRTFNMNLNLINKNKNDKPIKISTDQIQRSESFLSTNNVVNLLKTEEIDSENSKNKIDENEKKIGLTDIIPKTRHRSCTNDNYTSSIAKQLEKPKGILHSNSILGNSSDQDDLFDKVLNKIENQNSSKKKKKNSIKSNHSKVNFSNWEETSRFNEILSKKDEDELDRKETGLREYKHLKIKNEAEAFLDEDYSNKKKSDIIKIKMKDADNNFENEFYKTRNKSFNCNRSSSAIKFKNLNIERNSKFTNILKGENNGNISREFDLSFVHKELFYGDKSYNNSNSNKNVIAAIETLELAQNENKKKVLTSSKEENFWVKLGDFINPFKCGKDQ